ncbi:tetratricopeptide repeat protein [Sphingomonas sp.]|uniref:tetratricopeptide repeat protein n=1 Tax=Sphingomonas sp. TaxID=28214 RepID=UPI00307D80FB
MVKAGSMLGMAVLLVAALPGAAAGYPVDAGSARQHAERLAAAGRDAEAEHWWREHLAEVEAARPGDAAARASALDQLGLNLARQGRPVEGEPLLRAGLALRRAADPVDPLAVATSLNNLASCLQDMGRYEEAEAALRETLTLKEAHLPAVHPDLAASYANLGSVLFALARYAEGEAFTRRALALREQIGPPGSADIARAMNNLAANLVAQRRLDEAEPLIRAALALREAALPAGHPELAQAYLNTGVTLVELDRLDAAEPLLRKALALTEAAFPAGHPQIVVATLRLADCLYLRRAHDAAEALYRQAVARAGTLADDHPERIDALDQLSHFLERRRRAPDAVRSLSRAAGVAALARMDAYRGFSPGARAELQRHRPLFQRHVAAAWRLGQRWPLPLAFVQARAAGDAAAGVTELQRALHECSAGAPPGLRCFDVMLSLANVEAYEGDPARGEPVARATAALADAALPIGHADRAAAWSTLAACLTGQGRFADADAPFVRALAEFDAAAAPDPAVRAAVQRARAVNLDELKRYTEAEPIYRALLAMREAAGEAGAIVAALNDLAYNLDQQGQGAAAEALLRRALAIRTASLPAGHPDLARAYANLAANLERRGLAEAAAALRAQAAAMRGAAPH